VRHQVLYLIFRLIEGIGYGLAEKYAETGTHVIAVGRRKQQLEELANKHKGKISVKVFDLIELGKIPSFVEEVTKEHPDIDCVFLNSGIQRGFNFTKPETVDLDKLDQEFTINYTSFVHMYCPL
jgi:short-subunit dehydrogenase involved in D-alanine esterification of teichoic acids